VPEIIEYISSHGTQVTELLGSHTIDTNDAQVIYAKLYPIINLSVYHYNAYL
jgi:hypothetical protein